MACIARPSKPSLAVQSMCHFPAPGISSGLKRVATCQFSSQLEHAAERAGSEPALARTLKKKPWSVYFLRRTEAPLRGRLAERVCRFAHSLNLFVRGLPAPPSPRVHRVPASQLPRMRV